MSYLILVVDDSSHVQKMVREALESRSSPEASLFTVISAANGEEALEICAQQRPDAILADLTMPRMGGLELCRRLRLTEGLVTVPVLLLLSPFDELDELRVERVGAQGQLTKPLQPSQLLESLSRLLRPDAGADLSLSIEDPGDDDADEEDSVGELTEITELSEDLDPTELPEPDTLGEPMAASSDGGIMPLDLDALGLTEADRDRAELGLAGTEVLGPTGPRAQAPRSLTPLPLGDLLTPDRLEALVERVVRSELQVLLPRVVEQVVRERVAALEREIEVLEGFQEEE